MSFSTATTPGPVYRSGNHRRNGGVGVVGTVGAVTGGGGPRVPGRISCPTRNLEGPLSPVTRL